MSFVLLKRGRKIKSKTKREKVGVSSVVLCSARKQMQSQRVLCRTLCKFGGHADPCVCAFLRPAVLRVQDAAASLAGFATCLRKEGPKVSLGNHSYFFLFLLTDIGCSPMRSASSLTICARSGSSIHRLAKNGKLKIPSQIA